MKVCFVIPVFNERDTLRPLAEGIIEHIRPHECRIMFVDDGSSDGSYEELVALEREYEAVEVIRLRGNFGKSAALATGFAHAEGDLVITMDSDLQDDPKEIPQFLEKMDEGYDVVCGWKARRYDPWHKVLPSRFYNRFVSRLFGLDIHDVNCGFKAFRLDVVKKIQVYGEMHRLIPVMAHNLNFNVGEIPVEHHPRRYGKSKFGYERFIRGAMDVLTIWFLSRYQHAPGQFFGKLGIFQAGIGVLCVIAGLVMALVQAAALASATLFAVGFLLGASGLNFLGMGLLAELVLRHFIRIDPALYSEDVPSIRGYRR